jgi:hypothetical protein
VSWKIFYGDGTTLKGEGPLPSGAEARDVQAIVQDHPEVGEEFVTGGDWFVWRDGLWWAVDNSGLWDYVLTTGLAMQGRMMKREEYQKLVREAMKAKETWLPGERKFE